jgi:hypothetical protein
MKRFGSPLDPEEPVMSVAAIEVPGGGVLRHVRHRAPVDVLARDYLVYERNGHEPLCALATTVAGALGHLARLP